MTLSVFIHIFFSTMEDFPAVCCAFAVKANFSHTYSYIAMVREYQNCFNLVSSDCVPSRKTLLTWVKHFRKMAVASKKKHQAVRRRFIHSKMWNKCDNQSGDLHYHPYKILSTQEMKQTNYKQQRMFVRRMLTSIEEGEIPL